MRRLEVDKAADVVRTFKRVQVPVRLLTPESVIRVGDRVQIIPLDQEGEVVGLDDDTAEIQLGSLKTRQPLEALTRLGRARHEEQRRAVAAPAAIGFVPMEIDIRGQRVSEVEDALERYLEDAYRFGLPNVRIIHGKGTGALRQVVRDYLSSHPAVAKHVTAPANEGGDGATLAYFLAE